MLPVEITLGVLTVVLNFYLGFSVLLRNQKSWTSRLFFLLTVFLDLYVILNFLSLHPPLQTADNQLFWIRMVMAECSFIGPTLFLLVHTFPGDQIRLSKTKLGILLTLCLSSFLLSIGPFVFTKLEFINDKPVPTPGPGIPVFMLDFVGLFITSFVYLIYHYRHAQGREKIQTGYFLMGAVGTFSLMGLTTVIFVAILKNSDFVFLGPIFPIILVGFIFYSIIKHRFLDIRTVITRTVTFLLLVLFGGLLYASAFYFVGRWIIGKEQGTITDLLVTTILTLVVAFTFQPVRRVIQKVTDRFLFNDSYSVSKVLYAISLTLSTSLRLEDLTSRLQDHLLSQLRISKSIIILPLKDGKYERFPNGGEWNLTDEDISQLIQAKDTLVFDEIADNQVKDALRRIDASVVVPLKTSNEYVGAIILSDKASGNPYSDEDIIVLNTVAPEAAVAIENAKSYEEISKFNVTLQEEINKATADLQVANEKLKELDKKKDEFVSLASHELRTPMTSIKSYLWMALAGRGGDLNEKQRYYLDRSYNSTVRLIKLVNDMLNISRIESGRIILDIVEKDLKELLDESMTEVKPRADEMKVDIVPDYDDCGGESVLVDVDKIKEVLVNLLGNAIKFTSPGGVVTVTTRKNEDMVTISIKDTGEGLDPEDIEKLFQKFGLVKESYVTNQNASQGTGLGLYISKSIVELHKGKIWVESQGHGKGATFSFTLKISNPEDLFSFRSQYVGKEGLGIIRTTI